MGALRVVRAASLGALLGGAAAANTAMVFVVVTGDMSGLLVFAVVTVLAMGAISGALGGAAGALVRLPLVFGALIAATVSAVVFLLIESSVPLIDPFPIVVALIVGAASGIGVAIERLAWVRNE